MILSSAEMVAAANREIETISIQQAMQSLEASDVLFVDLRDGPELKTYGEIPGALHVPRGLLEFWVDPNSGYHCKEFSSGKKFVFFCTSAWRSALATKVVQDMGLKNVCHMQGGFDAWVKAGGAVKKTEPESNINARPEQALASLNKLGHTNRLAEQIGFILEIDKLKEVWRQTPLLDNSRKENDAEHSWQLAAMAVVLQEYAPPETDILRVLKMILIHDLVEIDAGDSPAYTGVVKAEQYAAESLAADRLFGVLPQDLAEEFRALWEEFEAMASDDALFARAMDRLQPFLHNYFTDGEMWIKYEINVEQVRQRMAIVARSSPLLHELICNLIDDSARQGQLLTS